MISQFSRCLAILLFVVTAAVRVSAQQPSVADTEIDPSATARYRVGPLRFTPSIELSDLGIDDNVFNEAENPKRDRIGAFGPASDVWMHVGRSLVTAKVSAQYLYFEQYASQRAWNTVDQLRWDVPLSRFTPFVEGIYANTKDRPGYEIDSRTRLTNRLVGVGSQLRLFSRTMLTVSGRRSRDVYDQDQTFLGANLAHALDRTNESVALQMHQQLTSLTSFIVNAEGGRDRFLFDSLRNADSVSIMPGFEMKPSALISGKVLVGFRSFRPLNPAIDPYQGPVAKVNATFTARSTRLALRVGRDVSYSYQDDQPYYSLTDVGLTLIERITHSWEIVMTAGGQKLDYTRIRTKAAAAPAQLDTIRQYGGGIGYRFGNSLRLGIDGTYYRRRSSSVVFRDFEGTRIGASIGYGLPQ